MEFIAYNYANQICNQILQSMKIEKLENKKNRANAEIQKKNTNNYALSFIDNRPISAIQKRMQSILNYPIQRMVAYDDAPQALDPRHFSTTDLKSAIDNCVQQKTIIPGWLKDQVLGYLQDELLERDQDMKAHGGGDPGHKHYFELVRTYADKVDSLEVFDDQGVPTDKTALQL